MFFDWFYTLADYHPRREDMHGQALHEHGIEVRPERLIPGLLVADREYFTENAFLPIRKRSPEEQVRFYTRYEVIMLEETGIRLTPDILAKVVRRVGELGRSTTFALFDDVIPTLKSLKERGVITGLLTNLDRDMKSICAGLGVGALIDFIITSAEVGSDKPNPPIFLAALRRAKVAAPEAAHVGDQYGMDVIGARGVGINPVLIDRFDQSPGVTDCPRIRSLNELSGYLS